MRADAILQVDLHTTGDISAVALLIDLCKEDIDLRGVSF